MLCRSLAALLLLVCARSVGGFTCTQTDTVCGVLGALYNATSGTSWTNNTGWSAAAAGTATSYCTFYGTTCSSAAVLTTLCVRRLLSPLRRPLSRGRRLTLAVSARTVISLPTS